MTTRVMLLLGCAVVLAVIAYLLGRRKNSPDSHTSTQPGLDRDAVLSRIAPLTLPGYGLEPAAAADGRNSFLGGRPMAPEAMQIGRASCRERVCHRV